MSRNYKLYLNDILTAIGKINHFVAGISQDDFAFDAMRVDSVLYNLMVIGEAVKNIPEEVKTEHAEVRWRDISRFRDRVVHHYFRTDLEIVWEIVQIHLPVLKQHTEKILEELESSSE
jgi:uncharacterized protein with HEPN domain